MSQLIKDFQAHPRSVGETYLQHWCTAMGFALTFVALALACVLHAFVPGLCKCTASRTIADMYRRMVAQRDRRTEARQATP